MTFTNIKFIASFGDLDKQVEISCVYGSSSSFHLSIDHYYFGAFHVRDGRWKLLVNQLIEYKNVGASFMHLALQTFDIYILEDMMNDRFPIE